ncbi:hypothetical protein [Calothrix sp. PCC 7507]|uniref:hypothetical protein n=1 Tax=Calothrix sp. PCC 7507 TaxID=99598 RepID=UPI00029F43EB|nr:hypothetical protein [Calothrix sp. PCC 7507]AFY33677.1 hypothetical protein Cal7507_3271 [Calothrix sp. PCC 7507]
MSDQYTFKVINETDLAITELWVSLDDEDWAEFELGESGIPSGETVTIAWAEYTNDSPCEWYICATFEDESESDSAIFNFCEEPALVFS